MTLPDEVGFAEAFGDVDVTLVFRPVAELDPPWAPGEAAGGKRAP
ncbi:MULTISPECIES: hypothetical protein [unclassified Frankia]|nr:MULTISPECIES: hypothetical protein [unclassified Frankia]